jgi:hypothetical protein
MNRNKHSDFTKENDMETRQYIESRQYIDEARRCPRARILCLALATVFVQHLSSDAARAATSQMCVPQVVNLPVSNGAGGVTNAANAPNILQNASAYPTCAPNCSGDPSVDTGWVGAFRFRLENGTPSPDGAFQVIQQGTMLYFSFQIYNAPDLDQNDWVVMGFDNCSKGGCAQSGDQYTWISIQPFALFNSGSNASIPAQNISTSNAIQSWSGSVPLNTTANNQPTWSMTTFAVNPTWVTAGTAATYDPGGHSTWYLVVGIDNSNPSGPMLPSSGQFGVYLSAVRSAGTSQFIGATEFSFPDQSLFLFTNADSSASGKLNPAPSTWATGTLDLKGTCAGVFITGSDITNTVAGSQTQNISGTQANNFSVKVHNSGVAAPQVTATFKIANFGLPAPQDWLLLGTNVCGLSPAPAGCGAGPHPNDSVANNPSTTGTPIPAFGPPPGTCPEANGDGCAMIGTGPWNLGTDNVNFYSQPDYVHECVRVDLDSLVGNTTILNNSAFNNFYYSAVADAYKSFPAFISANYPGNPIQSFTLNVVRQALAAGAGLVPDSPAFEKPTAAPVGGEKGSAYLNYFVEGCRVDGQTLTVQGAPTSAANSPDARGGVTPGPIRKLPLCDSVGAYGYLVRYKGSVASWDYSLSASGTGVQMTRVQGTHLYQLSIPRNTKAQIVSIVTPIRSGFNGCFGLSPLYTILLLIGIIIIGLIVYRVLRTV